MLKNINQLNAQCSFYIPKFLHFTCTSVIEFAAFVVLISILIDMVPSILVWVCFLFLMGFRSLSGGDTQALIFSGCPGCKVGDV